MTPNMEQALSKGIKDTMWAMFWKGKQKANLPELEEAVKRLIRMTTQKNAGQRKDATCIDWSTLDMEFMRIAIEAAAFVLDDRFEKLKEEWENDSNQNHDRNTENLSGVQAQAGNSFLVWVHADILQCGRVSH